MKLANPSEKMKLHAISHDPSLIWNFDNASEKIQMAAIIADIAVFNMIENPYPSVVKYYKQHAPKPATLEW